MRGALAGAAFAVTHHLTQQVSDDKKHLPTFLGITAGVSTLATGPRKSFCVFLGKFDGRVDYSPQALVKYGVFGAALGALWVLSLHDVDVPRPAGSRKLL
jgi:ABC-type Fe3+-siderophore transport system permease subunit